MFSHRLTPALASVGLGFGILFSAPLARDVYSGIERHVGRGRPERETARSASPRISEGELVARLTIARLSLDSPVFEGVAASTLTRGAGHVPETALPGDEKKNAPSLIALSRGRGAEAVERLRLGDLVRLTTSDGLRRYRVAERRTFEPASFRLGLLSGARVTLVAPYPADAAGPAPMRLAVSLERAPD